MAGGSRCPPGSVFASVEVSVYRGDAAVSVPAGNSIPIPVQHFATNDLAVFGTGRSGLDIAHNQPGDTYLEPLKAGMVLAMVDTEWEAGNYARDVFLGGLDYYTSLFPYHLEQQANTMLGVNGATLMPRDTYMGIGRGVFGGSVSGLFTTATNYDAVARTVRHMQIYCYWWPVTLPDTIGSLVVYGAPFS